MKEKIGRDLKSKDGSVHLLFCTEAYSMGADPPDVRHVIHVGPAKSPEGMSKTLVYTSKRHTLIQVLPPLKFFCFCVCIFAFWLRVAIRDRS